MDPVTIPVVKTIEEELGMSTQDKEMFYTLLDEVRSGKLTNDEAIRQLASYAEKIDG